MELENVTLIRLDPQETKAIQEVEKTLNFLAQKMAHTSCYVFEDESILRTIDKIDTYTQTILNYAD